MARVPEKLDATRRPEIGSFATGTTEAIYRATADTRVWTAPSRQDTVRGSATNRTLLLPRERVPSKDPIANPIRESQIRWPARAADAAAAAIADIPVKIAPIRQDSVRRIVAIYRILVPGCLVESI